MANEVKVYALGGTGINLVKNIPFSGNAPAGVAQVKVDYIDTSSANVGENNQVLVVNGSGSGMVRGTNYAILKEEIKEIFLSKTPSEMNILVHSASGGTGSILGNLAAKENLSNPNRDVIVMLVGSRGSEIEVKNTISTIKTYASISKEIGRVIPVVFFENTPETPRGLVDQSVNSAIAVLTVLFSGQNGELDKMDLSNWLNFNRVSEYAPDISGILIQTQPQMKKGWVPISMVTLADRDNSINSNLAVKLHKVGFVERGVASNLSMETPLSFINTLGYIPEVLKQYEDLLANFKSLDVVKVASIDTSGSKDGVFL